MGEGLALPGRKSSRAMESHSDEEKTMSPCDCSCPRRAVATRGNGKSFGKGRGAPRTASVEAPAARGAVNGQTRRALPDDRAFDHGLVHARTSGSVAYNQGMPILDREEYIEQAYFFRVLRERLAEGLATQTILDGIHQEILSTTRLPLAIQFLATELKHAGLLSSGFARLPHYFTPFQAFVAHGSEDETKRFSTELALLVLEREAQFRAGAI